MFAQLFRGSIALVAIGSSLLFINAPDKAPLQILDVLEEAATGDLKESGNLYLFDPSDSSMTTQCPAKNQGNCSKS